MRDLDSINKSGKGSLKTYTIGFVLSLILTISAYVLVAHTSFTKPLLVTIVVVLAIIQLIVQLIFFLHMASESKPRWNLAVFGFMLMVVFIIVFGSLWIMYNLDYNHAGHNHYQTPQQIIQDEGVKL